MTAIASNNSLILYQVEPGKPNPQGEMQGRVVQTAMKGGVNWYYTLNFLRNRIGKGHSEELKSEREIEQFFSSYRKKMTAFYDEMPSACNQLEHPTVKDAFVGITHQKAFEMLNDWDNSPIGRIDKHCAPLEENYVGMKEMCAAFATDPKEFTNLYDYLVDYRIKGPADANEVLAHFGLTAEGWYNDKMKERFDGALPWEELNDSLKQTFPKAMATQLAAEKYGLKIAEWKPTQPFEDLIASLKEHGPHYVQATMGSRLYTIPPFCLKDKIGERNIWGWKPGSPKQEREHFGTSLLLVGAQKKGVSEVVYFIDSEDASDPKDVETQKIYAVSYKTLKANLSDLYGLAGEGAESPFPYAIHK